MLLPLCSNRIQAWAAWSLSCIRQPAALVFSLVTWDLSLNCVNHPGLVRFLSFVSVIEDWTSFLLSVPSLQGQGSSWNWLGPGDL